jgi:hypothetical protein
MRKEGGLHYLNHLFTPRLPAADDYLVNDRIEDLLEIPHRKSNRAFGDPQAWISISNAPESEVITVIFAVKYWFKLPSIVRAGSSR